MLNLNTKPELPDLGCADYIFQMMKDIGFPNSSEGYVKHAEIKAYCDQMGITLLPPEHKMIFNGFIEYSNAKHRYESQPLEPAPFTLKTADELMKEKSNAIIAALRGVNG